MEIVNALGGSRPIFNHAGSSDRGAMITDMLTKMYVQRKMEQRHWATLLQQLTANDVTLFPATNHFNIEDGGVAYSSTQWAMRVCSPNAATFQSADRHKTARVNGQLQGGWKFI
jgi:hypothetical protein